MAVSERAEQLSTQFDIAELQMFCYGMIGAVRVWRNHPVALKLQQDIDDALQLAVDRERN